jgi:hypothetical protein
MIRDGAPTDSNLSQALAETEFFNSIDPKADVAGRAGGKIFLSC